MADEEKQDQVTAPRREGTRVPWIVMGVLILIGVATGIAVTQKKSIVANPGARAVIVPGDRTRSVIVPPCATGVQVTPANVASQSSRDGAIRVQLPAGHGVRVVVVPRCTAQPHATSSATSNLPSAAYVLPIAAKGPAARGGQGQGISAGIEGQIVVAQQSTIATLIVPPCEHSGGVPRLAGRLSAV